MKNLLLIVSVFIPWIFNACDSSSTNSTQCQNATQCKGDPGTGCTWTCMDGECKALCTDECQTVDDCRQLQWPMDCEGHWACVNNMCDAVCDETECSTAQDCSGEIQCPDGGHWICDNNRCVQICDSMPQCQQPQDCVQLSWTEECQGRWLCEEGQCQPLCDDEMCSNGSCDEEQGENTDTCPTDCDFSCEKNQDCDHLAFPLNCVGHWECDNRQCTPFCNGSECYSDLDCLGKDWDLKCVGHWDCVYGYCEGVCDAELCGDGFCDREGGEGPATCPDDCDENDCINEGLKDGPIYDCCEGLESLSDCFPQEICVPGSDYCVDCGNGSCDPHENQYNCANDCPDGCQEGEKVSYSCDEHNYVPWCECIPDQCPPICIDAGGGLPSGWVNSCTYTPYRQDNCNECHKECMEIGTQQEGWYSVCQSSQGGATRINLIVKFACAPRWDCASNPEQLCN